MAFYVPPLEGTVLGWFARGIMPCRAYQCTLLEVLLTGLAAGIGFVTGFRYRFQQPGRLVALLIGCADGRDILCSAH